MRTFTLSLGALALGLASAHTYPNCESDNCHNNLVDARFSAEAVSWCPEFLAGTTTAASAIPTNFGNCDGDIAAVSSACSCVTYTATATASTTEAPATTSTTSAGTTTEAPATTTTSSTEVEETTSECDSETESETETEAPASSTTEWTTSTITQSITKTITQCPVTVTNCPAHSTITTVEVVVTTTVCPVEQATSAGSSFPPVTVTPTSHFGTVTVGTTTKGPKPTSSVPVTAGAGRAVRGVEGIAAIAGLFAAFL